MDKKTEKKSKIDKKLIRASNLPDISDQKYKIAYQQTSQKVHRN